MMTLGTIFIIARLTIRTIKRRFFLGEEILIFTAWACMMAECINYIILSPAVYRIAAVARHERPADADIIKDWDLALRLFVVGGLLFWSCLWSVKIALLLQCKRLVERQRAHVTIWWCILAFTIVTYIVCVINVLTPCRSLRASLTYRTLGTAQVL